MIYKSPNDQSQAAIQKYIDTRTFMFAVIICPSKNGVIKNIGDYIQSIAAMQFVGANCKYIDREKMNQYDGEEVKLIMNGWFMHHPENWPPSNKINPLITSIHISPSASDKMLEKSGIEYLKKHQPIGCRDKGTEKFLKSLGIKSFYSSCLTITLGKTYKRQKISSRGDLCFVDAYYKKYTKADPIKFLKSLLTLLIKYSTIKKISAKQNLENGFIGLVRSAQFYRLYTKLFSDSELVGATYIKHMVSVNHFRKNNEMLDHADRLLRYYSTCSLVVTSRIHAALPCLGIGIPTIFVNNRQFNDINNPERGRFDGLIDLLNILEVQGDDFVGINGFEYSGRIKTIDSIKNPNLHHDYVEKLTARCFDFVSVN